MKVFISGPMTNYPEFNKPAFDRVEKKLVQLGYSVWNPAWIQVDDEWDRNDLLPIDIHAIQLCDAVLQLEGWDWSTGAKVEYEFAKAAGKIFMTEAELDKQIQDAIDTIYPSKDK